MGLFEALEAFLLFLKRGYFGKKEKSKCSGRVGGDKEDSCAAYQKQRTTPVSSLKEQMKRKQEQRGKCSRRI